MQKTIWASLTPLLKSGRQFSIQFVFSGYIAHYPDISENILQGILYFLVYQYRISLKLSSWTSCFSRVWVFHLWIFKVLQKRSSTIKVVGVRSLKLETDRKWIPNTLYNQSFGMGGNVITFVLHDCIQPKCIEVSPFAKGSERSIKII